MTGRPFDHGELNIPFYKRPSIDAEMDRVLAAQAKAEGVIRREAVAARKAAAEAEKARPKLTRADVEGATFVRDDLGWHRVVRVNTKTVTVATPWSWTDTILLDRILETLKETQP